MKTGTKIPDIKPIEKGRSCIEPAPHKYKKIVILTLAAIGFSLICLLVQGGQYLITTGTHSKLEQESEEILKQIATTSKVIQENQELENFYDHTQKWMSSNTFFCLTLGDIARSLPDSGKINEIKLSRKEEAYTLEINLNNLSDLSKSTFLKKAGEGFHERGLNWIVQEEKVLKDKSITIVGTAERKGSK